MEDITTAIYPNRIEDKNTLDMEIDLYEFGDENTPFIKNGVVFSIGYNRVVYGDHGPYVEFDISSIQCELKSKFGKQVSLIVPKDPKFYYYWLNIPGTTVKVYFQLKDVKHIPNAPRRSDGKPHRFNRKEGYADYRVGMLYVDPYAFDW